MAETALEAALVETDRLREALADNVQKHKSLLSIHDQEKRASALRIRELLEANERLEAACIRKNEDGASAYHALYDANKRIAELEAERDREKERRTHWQDLAYAAMNAVDKVMGTKTTEQEFKNHCATLPMAVLLKTNRARREGARKGMAYERRQEALGPDGFYCSKWTMPTEQEIDAALGGEVSDAE
jgi:hypothetical protein